ncbi:MAG TPA: polysaccharide biosynthesis tyrosine autokinase [Solirubrobacteraceae bacterium]|jgi:capsular exopolysaccharide synthesis family protein|nr:polysaccharide biosynthesis tyrosine autokinase [Solirubrobacteraceae bacterium]
MSAADRLGRAGEGDGFANTLNVLRRRWLIILGIVIACLLVSVVRHERAPKSYAATASVAFKSATLPDAALQVSSTGSGEPVRDAATEVLIGHSSEVAEGVRKQLNVTTSPGKLLEEVSVEAAPNADVLHFTATSGDPQFSARLANAFAAQYIAFKTAAQVASVEEAVGRLQRQISGLPAGSAARVSLEQSQQRLTGLLAVAGGGANTISRATPPSSPTGTKLSTSVIIGILIGLAVAFSVVFLLESLDRRVKTIEEFEREYRMPVLTAVPQASFGPIRADQRDSLLEPYRIVRSALDFAAVARPVDTLLVTSAVSGEGKTTVAVDLAHVEALADRRVVLIEMDLRRPTFAQHFGFSAREGLTTALARGGSVSDMLLQPLPTLPNLLVLPAGRLPPNPSEMLGAPAIAEIVAELAREDSMVIIDAPPLNPVADAHVLLSNPAVQAVIMVARIDKTTREEIRRASATLTRHTVDPVGLIVTGLRNGGRYGYEAYDPQPQHDAYGELLSRPTEGTHSPRQAR